MNVVRAPWWYVPATQRAYRDVAGGRSTVTCWPDFPSVPRGVTWWWTP